MRIRGLFAFFAVLTFSFFSCSDAAPDIVSASGSMIFDYADEESLPSSRLAIFVQLESEAQRADTLIAVHQETGYTWRVTAPKLFKSGDKQWACYTNLQPPENQHIPSGVYTFQYLDAAGEEADAQFTVAYPDALFDTKSPDIKTVLKSTTDSVALYDKNGVLIFFGKKKNNWRTNANITRDYNAAVTARHCLSANNNRVVCLLPAESLIEQPKAADDTAEKEQTTDD